MIWALLQLSPAHPFHFRPTLNIKDTLMLRVVPIRDKKRNNKPGILQTWHFTNMINSFCFYVIKLAGETAKKALLSVI